MSIMEIAVMSDYLQVLANHRALSPNHNHLSVTAAGNLQISARSTTSRAAVRTLSRRRIKRTRRQRRSSGGSGEDSLFGGGGGDGEGPIDGSGGRGGWNSDDSGGFDWDDSSSPDPAFDLVYEVVCLLLFSNCLHFAYKKIVRLVAAGLADQERHRVPMRMASVC